MFAKTVPIARWTMAILTGVSVRHINRSKITSVAAARELSGAVERELVIEG